MQDGKSCSIALRLTSAPPEGRPPQQPGPCGEMLQQRRCTLLSPLGRTLDEAVPGEPSPTGTFETSVMRAALTVKRTQHKAAFVSSYSGWLHISSVMQPKTRGVDTGERTIRKVCECDALDSAAYSFGVLTWKTTVHLRDALPCVFAKAESINNPEDMARPTCAVLMHYEVHLPTFYSNTTSDD
ncbi:hypothetical protein MRX96_013601 [Rhipicephalus microplus]